jgi:hypothetical protein
LKRPEGPKPRSFCLRRRRPETRRQNDRTLWRRKNSAFQELWNFYEFLKFRFILLLFHHRRSETPYNSDMEKPLL